MEKIHEYCDRDIEKTNQECIENSQNFRKITHFLSFNTSI